MDEFEHQIDETILKRGFDYFEKGYVTDVTMVGDGKALFIAWAMIEEMAIMVNYKADDSDGQIGGSIEEAFAVLEALTEMKLNKRLHDELFACMFSLFENDSLKDWDWHFTSMSLAIKLVKTNQEKEKIKSALDKIRPNGKNWNWDYEKAQELMLELIKKTESPEAATRFIENNLSNSKFRVELIERALQAKDYRKVERLASEGIARDEKEAPGRADEWRNYLLTVYRQTGDVKHVIELARYFLLHSYGRQQPLKYYYDLLKSLVPQDQWQDYLSNLINDINNTSRWMDYDRISQLYIWESQWDKLFELLRQNATFDRLGNAEKYIADSYRDELAALYRKLILAYLERYMGRPHYQTVCQYIQRMIKFGARTMARNLIGELKALYSNRSALLDELDKI